MTTTDKVVFVGLGVMGTPIAGMIHRNHRLVAVDLSPVARKAAAGRGLSTSESLEEALPGASHVCLMLPTVQASNAVVGTLLEHVQLPLTVIELGTVGPEASQANACRLEQAGHQMVDAPVIGGGQAAAEEGRLTTLIGGHPDAVEHAGPILRSMSRRQIHLGSAGAGQTMKLIHNSLLASIAAATAEALAACTRLGVNQQGAFDILSSSSTNSFVLDWLFSGAINGDYSSGAKVSILAKDLELAGSLWSNDDGAAQVNQAATRQFLDCLSAGLGQEDIGIILPHLEGGLARPARTEALGMRSGTS
ncbi:NAD(P)-dependent oxidoreductase [Arthrobacter sp. I2-34]|uniref:NAD(P)-dependent oxidoreductase n=1 Tax=Arthrobacter hankyongi TaxID=2904801 RepID=A0ABS9LDD4_9MICC|nr:NAD(P)-dependent oxidoreductase [Arthrobacter hankyongi]MCG2624714.1 NAD(P)-dependent oxidoreductase [Arthrobacter hankyongi]